MVTYRSNIAHNITVFPTNEAMYNSTSSISNVTFDDQSLGHVLIGFSDGELQIDSV